VSSLLPRVTDRNIRLIYLTILMLGVAYGLVISLVAVFLTDKGFDKAAIGQLAIFFGGGIVAFAIPAGSFIRSIGAKRVLVGSLAGYALAVGLFPFVDNYWAIGGLRFLDGAFSVGVWVSSETILLARAPREDKAYCTSIYAVALALGYVIGPLMAWAIVKVLDRAASFHVAGAIAMATAGVVALLLDARVTSDGHDDVTAKDVASSMPTGQVFWRIKMSCLATFSYGYFQASLVLFLPLYLIERGLSEDETIIVPALFALGMVLFANAAAQQGDRRGHLAVMRALAIVGMTTCVLFLFVPVGFYIYLTGFVAGASLASISPVSLALQGLVVPERELSKAGGLYNAAYALGMLVGPPIAGFLFSSISGRAMIVHFAALWAVFVTLTLVFRRDDPRVAQTS